MKWKLEMLAVSFAAERGLVVMKEHQFHPVRKWRFDFYYPELNTAVEYEGIFSAKSRHTSVKGFSGDTEKYNEAAKMGIKVLRYTAMNYGNITRDLKELHQKISI